MGILVTYLFYIAVIGVPVTLLTAGFYELLHRLQDRFQPVHGATPLVAPYFQGIEPKIEERGEDDLATHSD